MPAFIFIKFKSKIEKITMEKSIIFIKFRSKVEKNMKHLCLKLIKMLDLPPYDVWRKQKISNFIKLQILPPWDFFLQFWTTIVQPSNPLQTPLWYTDRQIEQSVHGLTSLKSEYLALSTNDVTNAQLSFLRELYRDYSTQDSRWRHIYCQERPSRAPTRSSTAHPQRWTRSLRLCPMVHSNHQILSSWSFNISHIIFFKSFRNPKWWTYFLQIIMEVEIDLHKNNVLMVVSWSNKLEGVRTTIVCNAWTFLFTCTIP